LGLVYANEPALHTAKTLMVGAFHFSNLLKRWCDLGDLHHHLSTPFIYGLHTQSMLLEAAIDAHFCQIERLYRDLRSSTRLNYLDLPGDFVFEKLTPHQTGKIFALDRITTAYRTIEHAIDTAWVAEKLREAVVNQPKITWWGNTKVEQAARLENGQIGITLQTKVEMMTLPYDRVINCLWEGRLQLDASLGIYPARPWLHRFKLGIYLQFCRAYPEIPSTTLMLGSFGDVVNFQDRKIYCSWYPDCMVGMSQELSPPNWQATLTSEKLEDIFQRSMVQLTAIHPVLQQITPEAILDKKICGGEIFAWGKTDIDDITSELHHRYQIGIHSIDNYHSIDTGKYTTAPYFAMKVCDRISQSC
jgi:hypothetical protein